MAEHSTIEWTHNTFNAWWGCTHVSPGCENCYAEGLDKRWNPNEPHWGRGRSRRLASDEYWDAPTKWNRRAARTGVRKRVFGGSMCDIFDPEAPRGQLARLWSLISATPQLDWLLLTKRPERILESLPKEWGAGWPNAWIGVTVEDQRRADERLPLLAEIPAVVRFLSCEPLLEDLSLNLRGIDWVIAGGESASRARPAQADWFRSIRDQCVAGNVPFFFKQWGTFGPCSDGGLVRLGKKRAGRVLEGREWNEFPAPQCRRAA